METGSKRNAKHIKGMTRMNELVHTLGGCEPEKKKGGGREGEGAADRLGCSLQMNAWMTSKNKKRPTTQSTLKGETKQQNNANKYIQTYNNRDVRCSFSCKYSSITASKSDLR